MEENKGMSANPDLHQKVSYLPELHRMLPQAQDAERGVLSSFLLAPKEVGGLCSEKGIKTEHFHAPHHATIYRTLVELWNDNEPIDFITLTQVMRDANTLDQCGGAAVITELFTFLPTASNAAYYIEILQEKYTLRKIIQVCTEYAARSYDEQHDPTGLLDSAEADILAIRKNDSSEIKETEPETLVMQVVHDIEQSYERKGEITGLSSGFIEIDKCINGLQPTDMIVIAARPSMGKTALATSIAENVAITLQKTVAFFTLEMSAKALMNRAILSRAKVNMHNARMGFISDRDFPALTAAASKFAAGKLRIIDAIGTSISALRAKARRIARQHPDLSLILVDYLQQLRSTSRQAQGSREREISEISAGLKNLAKELNIPVIVLAQLNRDVEKRAGGGRPKLSDLRESGSIEQDADIVGLLYREEYYAEGDEAKREVEGKATLIIAKNRNGPVGDVPLTFLKEFARYESRARAIEEEEQTLI